MIKVGIAGAGLIGTKRAAAMAAFADRCLLTAVCDVDAGRARSLADAYGAAAFANWRDMLEHGDIDAVVVSTPNVHLKDITVSALSGGKHVLCEKPLGRNPEEAAAMVAAAVLAGKILKTGFNHRHHPAIWKAKVLAAKGAIGKPCFIRCVYGHGGRPGYEKEWRADRELCGGGELLDQGVHVVDLFRWFMGEFEQASGYVGTFAWKMDVEDNAFAMFTTDDGRIAVMHTSWTQWKNKFLFEVFGDAGYLIVNGLGGSYGTEKLLIGRRKRNESGYAGGAPDEDVTEFGGPDISWQEEWKEFLSALEGNRQPLGSGHDGLMANKMIAAVYRSAGDGRPVVIG